MPVEAIASILCLYVSICFLLIFIFQFCLFFFKAIALEHSQTNAQCQAAFVMATPRIPVADSFDATRGDREKVISLTRFPLNIRAIIGK